MEIRGTEGKGPHAWIASDAVAGEEGQALIEYALIVSLMTVICIVALATTGKSISDVIDLVANSVY